MAQATYEAVGMRLRVELAALRLEDLADFLSRNTDDLIRSEHPFADYMRMKLKEKGILQQDVTLREGKYIVGDDIMPGTYTLKCTETSGDTYGGLYSSLGDLYGGVDSALGGLMGSLGGMMSDIINTEVEIIGDYGTVLKSYELKAGESVQITLSENTALKISEGTCVLSAE